MAWKQRKINLRKKNSVKYLIQETKMGEYQKVGANRATILGDKQYNRLYI